MKVTIKDILKQVIDKFEDGMNIFRKESMKHTTEKNNTLQNLQDKIESLTKSIEIPPVNSLGNSKSSTSSAPLPPDFSASRTILEHEHEQKAVKQNKTRNLKNTKQTTYHAK